MKGEELDYAIQYHERKRETRLAQAKEQRKELIRGGGISDDDSNSKSKNVDSKILRMLEKEGKQLDKLKER